MPLGFSSFRTRLAIALLVVCAAIALLAIRYRPQFSWRTELNATTALLDVRVHADRQAHLETLGDSYKITVAGHEVGLEGRRLLVDRAERATLPAGVKKVDFTVASKNLTVSADGADILTTSLR